jgi:hypothetical protein
MSDFGRAVALAALLGAFSCSVKSLPPGTPPPEYERRSFEPWPPAAADAGSDAEPLPAPSAQPEPADASVDAPDASVFPDGGP